MADPLATHGDLAFGNSTPYTDDPDGCDPTDALAVYSLPKFDPVVNNSNAAQDQSERGRPLKFLKRIFPVVTHALVAVIVFTGAFYFCAFLAIGAEINQCGTDTEYTLGWNSAGEKVKMVDVSCGWMPPGHQVVLYRTGVDGNGHAVLRFSTDTFEMPRAVWMAHGKLVITVPPVRSLSFNPDAISGGAIIKFGRIS